MTIAVKMHTPTQWHRIADTLAADAMLTAKLLAGELPPAVEGILNDAGLPLFPVSAADLVNECSCPDWSNPCKHIAAVFYLLAEEIDRDAFLLPRLRGLSREALVEMNRFSRSWTESTPMPRARRTNCWRIRCRMKTRTPSCIQYKRFDVRLVLHRDEQQYEIEPLRGPEAGARRPEERQARLDCIQYTMPR